MLRLPALSLPMLSLRRQWPFWVSGVFVGVAEIMNYIVLHKPIGLTSGLVEMTAAFEQTVAPGIDWWSRAYDPDVYWIIIGVVIVGLLYWSIRRGMRLTSFSFRDLMTRANDELTIEYSRRFSSGGSPRRLKDQNRGDTGFGETVTENA